ncbi:MAG: O-antigen ligase family protein, partial [bacterium]|nr:O-antigen ligase family protein [bacterium]
MKQSYIKVVEIILIGMVFLIPVALYTGTADAIYIKQVIFNLGAVALLAVWIAQSVREKKLLIEASALNLPIIAFFAWSIIIFLISPYKYAGLREVLQLAGYVVLYLTLTTGFRTDKGMGGLLTAALVAAALTCIYGLLQRFGIDPVGWDISRILSFMGNPTYYAAYLAILLPLAINLFLGAGSATKRIATGSLAVVMFLCLLLTYTRAAWLGVGVALLLDAGLLLRYVGCRKLYQTGAIKLALLLCVILAAVTVTAARTAPSAMKLEERLATSFSTAQKGNAQRVIIWKAALGIIRDHPLIGTGPGTFIIYYPRYQDNKAYT